MNYDVCVIGAGPGGYVAAIRSAQLGKKTVIIERESLGGICLNVGCIPSKAMISAAHFLHRAQHDSGEMGINLGSVKLDMKKLKNWKGTVVDRMTSGVSQLLKGNKVDIIIGEAEFKTSQELSIKTKEGVKSLKAINYIIATGSRPIEISGFNFDEQGICSSTGALNFEKVPKDMVVIGGGYIGLEIGSYMQKLGSNVTIVEAGQKLLAAAADPDCAKIVERKLKKSGVKVLLNAKAKSCEKSGGAYIVTVDLSSKEEKIKTDKVLVTVGRKPNSDEAGLKKIKLNIDEKGFVSTDAQCRTSLPHIFAIGDIAGQPMLAHKASHEGMIAAEVIAGKNRVYDAKTVPAVIFTDPEIASAGMTEDECKAKGYKDLKISKFPFAANGKAVSLMETEGFVKFIANEKTGVILGVHIVGPEASNLISEAVLAIEMGATLEDVALTIHPHPTLGETMMESAEMALGHAIHVIQKPLTR